MRRLVLVFWLSILSISLWGQDDTYKRQLSAVESLISSRKYESARRQATALIDLGRQSQLPDVEARAHYLVARSFLDVPEADARMRVEGIKSLQAAGRIYSRLGERERVNSILKELNSLTGKATTLKDLRESDRTQKQRNRPLRRADSLALESQLLQAMVNNQTEAIDSLTAEQLESTFRLQRQQSLLDSLALRALEDSILVVQQELQLNAQAAEIGAQRQARNFLLLLGAAILSILGVLYWRFVSARRYQSQLETKNTLILAEQQRSEELLLNVLPASVAAELKEKGSATARRHEEVSVLFADFKGFSTLAKDMAANEMVGLLDEAFRAFDRILRQHGLEKIKTIGDAYMCAAGLPEAAPDHAERCVKTALAMQDHLADHTHFRARIGVHSGPVVAGVVGLDKFAYDIWGDTVNRAARLEVSGEVGRVNVSRETMERLDPDRYQFTERGTLPIKNLGEIEMFFVDAKD